LEESGHAASRSSAAADRCHAVETAEQVRYERYFGREKTNAAILSRSKSGILY
jgi:hypothetical protein